MRQTLFCFDSFKFVYINIHKLCIVVKWRSKLYRYSINISWTFFVVLYLFIYCSYFRVLEFFLFWNNTFSFEFLFKLLKFSLKFAQVDIGFLPCSFGWRHTKTHWVGNECNKWEIHTNLSVSVFGLLFMCLPSRQTKKQSNFDSLFHSFTIESWKNLIALDIFSPFETENSCACM